MPLSYLDLRREGNIILAAPGASPMVPRIAGLLAALGMTLILASSAAAQVPRYSPPIGRTLPNELNYFNLNTTVLDQYNGIVNPVRQLDNQLRNMQNETRADFQSAQRAISQIKTSNAAPTGVGAGFMNYSHYYRLQGRSPNR